MSEKETQRNVNSNDAKPADYKLLADPLIRKGEERLIRYNGETYNTENHGQGVVIIRDPRPRMNRLWSRRERCDLPVPRYKVDEWYIGAVPPREITFSKLNDNITKQFMEKMCSKFGKLERVRVYYHPKTQKHMGLSKVVFTSMKSAAECVKKLHNTSIMGNIIHVQIDSKGELLNKLFQRIARGDMVAETVPNVVRQNQDGVCNKFKDKPHRRPSKDGTRRHSQDDPRKSRKSVDESERNANTPRRHHRRDSIKEIDELNESRPDEKFHDAAESTDTDTARKPTISSDRDDTQSDQEHQPVDLDSRISSLLQGDLLASREPDRRQDAPPDRASAEPRQNGPAPAPTPVHHHNDRELRDIDQRTMPPHTNSAPDLVDDRYVPNDRLRFERDDSREHSPRYRQPRPDVGPDDMKMHGYRYERDREPPPGRRYYSRPPGYDRGYYRDESDKEYRRRGYSPPRGHYRPGPHSRYRHPSPERFDHGRYSPPPPRGRPDRFRGSRSPEGWRRSSPGYRGPIDGDRERRRHGRSPSPGPRGRADVEAPRESSRRPSGDTSKMTLDQRLKEMTGEATGRQTRKKKDLTKEQHLDNASSVDMEISEGESDAGDKQPQGNGYDNRIADQDAVVGTAREGWNITGPQWNGQGVPAVEGHMWGMSQHEGFERNPQIPGHFPNYTTEAWPGHFHPPVVPPGMMPPYNFAPPDSYRMMNNAAGRRHDPHAWGKDENLCQCILSAIVEDLKSTVSRDLNRKVVETMAFKVYESWWDENANARAPPKPVSAPPEKTVPVEKPDPTPNGRLEPSVKPDAKLKNQSLLNAFDPLNWAKNSFEMDGFRIGLGLRSAVSKMPSFRVKKRPRSPSPVKDEDGGKKLKTAPGKENRERIRTPSGKKHHRIAVLDSEGEDDRSDGEDSYAESDHESRVKSGVLNVDEVFSDSSESSALSSSDEKSSDEESSDSESDEDEGEENEEEVVPPPPRPVVEEIKIKEPAEPASEPNEARRESEASETADEPKAVPKTLSDFTSESRLSTESDTPSNVDDSNISSLLSPTAHGVAPGAITPQQLRHVHPKKRHRLISRDQYEPFAKVPATDRDKLKDDLSHITEKERTVLEALTDLHKTPERRVTTDSDASAVSLHDKIAAPPPAPVSPQNELDAVQALLSFKEVAAKQPPAQKRPAVRLKYRDPVTLAESALVADLAEEHSYFARPQAETVPPGWDPAVARILDEHNYSRAVREESASDTERPTSPLSVSTLSAESVYNFKEDIPETITAAERVKLRREQPKKTRRSPKKSKSQAEVRFAPRTKVEDLIVAYEMWCSGLDLEDMKHLRKVYEDHLEDAAAPTWVNDSHWVPHPVTAAATPKKSRSRRGRRKDDAAEPHKTGSARTEGYYKLEHGIKLTQRREMYGQKDGQSAKSLQMAKSVTGNGPEAGAGCSADKSLGTRETRHFMRRIAAEVGADMGDLFKYNQLMFRKKAVKFKRSSIHGWGLFAEEAIGADEMVIEYVGQVVRTLIAERREVNYTELGIGSSYLFRIDTEHIIDATKCGNYARFMNHSCNPSCYAKVITVDTAKKIVIYSKGPIAKSQEITYDYKFPLEDDKVMCYCGAENCRRTLN